MQFYRIEFEWPKKKRSVGELEYYLSEFVPVRIYAKKLSCSAMLNIGVVHCLQFEPLTGWFYSHFEFWWGPVGTTYNWLVPPVIFVISVTSECLPAFIGGLFWPFWPI